MMVQSCRGERTRAYHEPWQVGVEGQTDWAETVYLSKVLERSLRSPGISADIFMC